MGLMEIAQSISKRLPEIKAPVRPGTAREKLLWTGLVLILFFVMYNITAIGAVSLGSQFDFLQMITASRVGSLLTIGIGPIVLASIFLQLFVGAKIINLDMSNPEEKKKFHEVQKVLAILIALVEALIFVLTGRVLLSPEMDPMLAIPLVIFQVTLGSVILLYLDEVVTKYGIGSGISLFIAAGVSFSIIGGAIALVVGDNGVLDAVSSGGAEAIPAAILAIAPFLFTIIVFLGVVYGEGMKVEIPLAYQAARGFVPKLPLNLFYLSNIPVIFASALLMNIQLFSAGLAGQTWEFAGVNFAHILGYVDSSNALRDGFLYFLTPIYAGSGTVAHINFLLNGVTPIFGIPEWFHAIIYIIFLSLVSVMFGLFWAETANMDSKSVAKQLIGSGMQIPGWRRDPRMMEKILEKYIPPLIILGSFLVGLLAAVADLTGALGTGTGILLTVSIFYRTYMQMKQQKLLDGIPFIREIGGTA